MDDVHRKELLTLRRGGLRVLLGVAMICALELMVGAIAPDLAQEILPSGWTTSVLVAACFFLAVGAALVWYANGRLKRLAGEDQTTASGD